LKCGLLYEVELSEEPVRCNITVKCGGWLGKVGHSFSLREKVAEGRMRGECTFPLTLTLSLRERGLAW
jgi:hypothetical protein